LSILKLKDPRVLVSGIGKDGIALVDNPVNPELEESTFPLAKVLVVDDTQANLLAFTALLEPLGHEIVAVSSGAEALARLACEDFALVLLDMMMPGMDGLETLSRMKSLAGMNQTAVILLTAYELNLRQIEQAYALGAVDYVLKPVAAEVLRGKVAAFVSLYRRGQELRRRGAALAAKDRLIAILAHDLRGPLTTITAGAQVLLRPVTERPVDNIARRVVRAAERMDGMIHDLLDYARTGTGAMPVEPVAMDVGSLCSELSEDLQLANPDARIDIALIGNLQGEWDRARLYQALLNLVGNALRHGAGTVAIQVRRTEGTVEVTVRNEGTPIPDELLPIIFDPFQRGEERGSGLGLGLYIVREIARAHGGDVSVVSSSHQGTTFTLCLPIGDRRNPGSGSEPPPTVRATRRRPTTA